MKLTIQERLELLELLPKEESYAGIKEVTRAYLLLNLTGDEAEKLEVVQEGNNLRWNQEAAMTMIIDVPMGEWLTNKVRVVLRQMDRDGKIGPQLVTLFEKFILDYE